MQKKQFFDWMRLFSKTLLGTGAFLVVRNSQHNGRMAEDRTSSKSGHDEVKKWSHQRAINFVKDQLLRRHQGDWAYRGRICNTVGESALPCHHVSRAVFSRKVQTAQLLNYKYCNVTCRTCIHVLKLYVGIMALQCVVRTVVLFSTSRLCVTCTVMYRLHQQYCM